MVKFNTKKLIPHNETGLLSLLAIFLSSSCGREHLKRNDLETGNIPIKSDSDIVQFRWVMVID